MTTTAPTLRARAGAHFGGRRALQLPNGAYRGLLSAASLIFVGLMTTMIVVLVAKAEPAFAKFGFLGFITSTAWNPVKVQYGALAFIVGTLQTTLIAMVLAVPIGIGAALAIAYLLPPRTRSILSGAVELGAAVPSVIFGLWGLLVVAPWARTIIEPAVGFVFGHSGPGSGAEVGIGVLLAGLILFVMIIPTMVAISRDVFAAVPTEQIEAAIALGATRWQTLRHVVVPNSRSGLLGAVTLSMGRAIGETMAVTMVIGNTPAIAKSLFGTGATMASIIANQFTEAEEPYHLTSLFAVAVVLLIISALVNVAARVLVRSIGHRSSTSVAVV